MSIMLLSAVMKQILNFILDTIAVHKSVIVLSGNCISKNSLLSLSHGFHKMETNGASAQILEMRADLKSIYKMAIFQ